MGKRLGYILLMLLLCTPTALACTNTSLLVLTKPYHPVNQTYEIQAYYLLNETPITNATINISYNGTQDNLTYDATGYYKISISDNTEEDIDFTIKAGNNTTTCQESNFTIKFRIPYNVTISLYKDINGTTKQYYDEFTSLYFLPKDTTQSYQLGDVSTVKYFNKIGNLFPYYEDVTYQSWQDTNIYFWGDYTSGSATITLYETGNYTLYAISEKVIGNKAYPEFKKPISDPDGVSIDNKIVTMELNNKTNKNVGVYFDLWDVAKTTVIKNWMYLVFGGIIWLTLVVFVSRIDVKAGGAIAVLTLPFLLKLAGVF